MRNLIFVAAVTAAAAAAWLWWRPDAPPPLPAAPPAPAPRSEPLAAPLPPPPVPPLAAGFCDPDGSEAPYEIKHTLRGLLLKSPSAALLKAPLEAAEAAARANPSSPWPHVALA